MFDVKEIEAIQSFQLAYNKTGSLLNELQPVFKKHFGRVDNSTQQDKQYLTQEGWLGLYKQNLLAETKHSTLFFGLGRAKTCYKPWIGIYLRLTPSWSGLAVFEKQLRESPSWPQKLNADLLSELRKNDDEWILFFFQRLAHFDGQSLEQVVNWSANLMQQMRNLLNSRSPLN